jgi:hypothetical protein
MTTPWKPSKPVAYLIAVLTVWPPIYFCLFISFVVFSFASFGSHSSKSPGTDLFRYIFPLHLLTMLLMFALTAVYIVHAFRTDQLAQDKRLLWVVVLFFGSMFAFPIYWWFYLRPSRPIARAEPSAPYPPASF